MHLYVPVLQRNKKIALRITKFINVKCGPGLTYIFHINEIPRTAQEKA